MDKEKQVEEMAKLACEVVFGGYEGYEICGDCFGKKDNYYGCKGIAEGYYAAGYRKQSDVVKEVLTRISKSIACQVGQFGIADLKYIAAEYGVEVNK